jgi:hypothetical protein
LTCLLWAEVEREKGKVKSEKRRIESKQYLFTGLGFIGQKYDFFIIYQLLKNE